MTSLYLWRDVMPSVVCCMTLHICPPDNLIKSGTKLINKHMFLSTVASYSSLQIYQSEFERFTYLQASCIIWRIFQLKSKSTNLIFIYWSITIKLTETIKLILFLTKLPPWHPAVVLSIEDHNWDFWRYYSLTVLLCLLTGLLAWMLVRIREG